ncbi:ubiquitin carboxyl-terminal hydrolase 2-like [Watersipora subatra]|uniref:ubiquitin carboxyl-terminal hydrolase 2-like n=1 Tax=Watersipora subatra TaxID=2589382 RepID=UPI00355B8F77
MPTSSGVSFKSSYQQRHSSPQEKLLYKRPSEYSSSTYSSVYSPSSYENTASYSTSHIPTSSRITDGLSSDFSRKADIKGTGHRSTTSEQLFTLPPSSTSITGSYPKSHVSSNSTRQHKSSGSFLSSLGRSSSVESRQSHSRNQLSDPAMYNYNDSCTSHDSQTAMKSTSAKNFDGGNVGLTNLGNTCFMNSVLQCLLNTRSLTDYVLSEDRSRDINTTTSSMKGALMEEYAKLVRKVWEDGTSSSIAPRELKSKITRFSPRFSGYNQQDAQEFLRYFLEGLHADVNRVRTKPKYIGCDEEAEAKMQDSEKAKEYWRRYINFDDSAIVDLFVGQLKSELKCMTCGYKSVTFDPFWDLSLPIPKSRYEVDIQACMESFMKEEMLDGDEMPTCAKCKTRKRCAKTFKIQKFPKILVLHLKRFSGERYRQKLSTKVNFEVQGFNLKQFGVDSTRSVEYNLYGISNHVGSVYSGHYTAYCKHPHRSRWYSFNDSRVSSISSQSLISEEAYVLFYEQV